MIYIIGSVILIAVIAGPGIWAKLVLQRHSKPDPAYRYTGQQFAQRLIEQFRLKGVTVAQGQSGMNCYELDNKRVCLEETYFQQPSLTAITVAAHEVGHAIQDYTDYQGMRSRQKLAKTAMIAGRFSNGALIAAPLLGLVSRSPSVGLMIFGVALVGAITMVLVRLATLPVEIDASFNRALPILKDAGYLNEQDLRKARSILRACALTYVANSLQGLLQLQRFFRR